MKIIWIKKKKKFCNSQKMQRELIGIRDIFMLGNDKRPGESFFSINYMTVLLRSEKNWEVGRGWSNLLTHLYFRKFNRADSDDLFTTPWWNTAAQPRHPFRRLNYQSKCYVLTRQEPRSPWRMTPDFYIYTWIRKIIKKVFKMDNLPILCTYSPPGQETPSQMVMGLR